MPVEDEQGSKAGIKGAVTAVHKPLGSGAEFSQKYDTFLGLEGGVLVPKSHPVAVEMRRYYQELKWWYGNEGFVRLYREGELVQLLREENWGKQESVECSYSFFQVFGKQMAGGDTVTGTPITVTEP